MPWALLFGFLVLCFFLFGERILPARAVTLENVVTVRETKTETFVATKESTPADPWSGETLFQASGWVEPDPLPLKATSLVDGIVESVSVLEGETVTKGQVIASLIREDFVLDVETAESDLAALRGRFAAHRAAISATTAQLNTLDLRVKAGEMRCLELIDQRDRLLKADGGAVAEAERVNASLRLQTHEGEVAALAASRDEIESEQMRLEALSDDFAGQIKRAETELARKELALARTQIKAPVDGIVLRLLVSPGQKRMLAMDDPDSSTVAILYQPDSLQARIDVPLEEASQLGVGQAVRLRSNFLQDRIFEGSVTRIVGEADLQRNTLQVKVRFHDPDARLRPDMLCRAEFLSTSAEGGSGLVSSGAPVTNVNRVSVYVPAAALVEREKNAASVWTIDPSGKRAEKRQLTLGSEERDGFVHVPEGMRPGDRVVINPPSDLAEGERLRINPSTPES